MLCIIVDDVNSENANAELACPAGALLQNRMSETVDITVLSGVVLEMSRDLRLMQLQLDSMASRLSGQDGRLGVIEGRLGALEGSFHDLVGETSRGFGQQQQQLTRLE